ncbi:M55 family metallopeptidase [Streptosporangium sp. KLBMP 9127]|nr:M55 family metallopeptidase [Streptosporangium sp. KLBMP 9127]
MVDAILDVRSMVVRMAGLGSTPLLTGSYGAPVVLAGGDDATCEELSAQVPQAVTRR